MSFQYELISAMGQWGLHINSVNLTPGIYHRFKSMNTCSKSSTKCCEYRVFENEQGAHLKCWRRGIDHIWFAKSDSPLSREDRERMAEERAAIERLRVQTQIILAAKCRRFYAKCRAALPSHPYAKKKGIYPHGVRQARGMLVIPITNIDMQLITLQFIMPNGFKKYKTGASAKGGMVLLTNQGLPLDWAGVIRVCEGWATGCTIFEITRDPVVCAMNAHNMPAVARALRDKFPQANLKICADNDQWGKENIGMEYALRADIEANAIVYWPTFDGLDVSGKPTDFNDLFLLSTKEDVRRQLNKIRI